MNRLEKTEDQYSFTEEKFKALLIRLFTDGCKGWPDFYRKIVDNPATLAKTLRCFLCPSMQIVVKSCDLLAILKDAFQEGEASYPETRESVIQRLIEVVPKSKTVWFRNKNSIEMTMFDKFSIPRFTSFALHNEIGTTLGTSSGSQWQWTVLSGGTDIMQPLHNRIIINNEII